MFNDDEFVTDDSGSFKKDFDAGKVALRFIKKDDAPLEATPFNVIVELTGSETAGEKRCGVDIVTVLDVSGSMDGMKLEKLKQSMKFLVKKLTPIDRLSVVEFSRKAERLCPLLAMTKESQDKVETLIDDLKAKGGTNITGSLIMALQVLGERRYTEGRTSAIMLMSDGEQGSRYADPSTVSAGDVPVFTFGLGKNHDSELLQGIAKRSNKGTYSTADVEGSDSASLNIAFSTCLAGLLSVVVEDLKIVITPSGGAEIKDVRVGLYDKVPEGESVAVVFGNLYNREKRMATIFLNLPAVSQRSSPEIIRISYSCKPGGGGKVFTYPPLKARVIRTDSPKSVDPPELINEIARGDTADAMKKARLQADAENYDGAKETLKKAEKSLDELNRETDELMKSLKYEVQHFLSLLKNPETYKKEGRAFALSSELSHGLQRFAARGDTTQLLALAVPLAVLFTNQAKSYNENPEMEVPTQEQDEQAVLETIKEIEKASPAPKIPNPMVERSESLKRNLGQAINSLQAIQELIAKLNKT